MINTVFRYFAHVRIQHVHIAHVRIQHVHRGDDHTNIHYGFDKFDKNFDLVPMCTINFPDYSGPTTSSTYTRIPYTEVVYDYNPHTYSYMPLHPEHIFNTEAEMNAEILRLKVKYPRAGLRPEFYFTTSPPHTPVVPTSLQFQPPSSSSP